MGSRGGKKRRQSCAKGAKNRREREREQRNVCWTFVKKQAQTKKTMKGTTAAATPNGISELDECIEMKREGIE